MGYIKNNDTKLEAYLTDIGKELLIEKGLNCKFFVLGDSDIDYNRLFGNSCILKLNGRSDDNLTSPCMYSGGTEYRSVSLPDITGAGCNNCLNSTGQKEIKHKILYNKCK